MIGKETLHPIEEPRIPSRFVLPSLSLSYFAVWPSGVLMGLLLLDIAQTFGQPVGVTGRIPTVTFLVTAITAVFMGVLSVRFDHKSLLLLELLLINISALGSVLALNFPMMLATFSISGIGMAMAEPMIYTLLAAHIPLEQRGRAIGWLVTGATLAPMIGAPVMGYIAGLEGWRMAFLGFVFPIALLGLGSATKGVPSFGQGPHPSKSKEKFLEGLKEVLTTRSAAACLGGVLLATAGFAAVQAYATSFFRERFEVSLGFASLLVFSSAICYMVGAQVSGRIINRVGRRPLTVATAVVTSLFIILCTNTPTLGLALPSVLLGSLSYAMFSTTAYSLALEQVPNFRGSMMSLNSAAVMFGASLGAGVGGSVLLWLGYGFLGLTLGALSLVAAAIYYFLVIDERA